MASGSADLSRLPSWQEDMHWLLLIIANSVVSEDIDGTCRTEGDVFESSVALVNERGHVYSLEHTDSFLCQCIENPAADRSQATDRVDPYLRLIGEVLAWASLEHQLVSEAVANFISPELTRSSFLCLRRLLSAASSSVEYSDADPLALPVLPQTGSFTQLIVKFVVRKVFTILNKFAGEEKLNRNFLTTSDNSILQHCQAGSYLQFAIASCNFVFLGDDRPRTEDSATLYRTIVMIVDVYRSEQASRFVGMTENDEDKGSDLVLFLDILSNVLSKDILEGGEDNVATGAQVALASLEMLLSVMNESVLKLPDLAMKFFRLVLYLVEFSREALAVMSVPLLVALCQCLREGMTSQYGSEIACTSMEALTEIVSYFILMNRPVLPELAQQFTETLPPAFDRFVNEMLSSKSNESASNKLREEFASLLPEDPKPGRRER
ncbi:hypothetical protein TELCIR_13735 [Teladorsagia circumcincta]|uniref:Exportin-1 C-terminal domain-containing protein n=1 Tax=Teladorsagia circumcincta TaxID=45464 RepID=A0A2G9U2Z0_TELCI|nr:hypothetical protein TELCIR_13735 [Teladorsagia circumcincta]